jgi:CheY-like chemotaxis protein
LAVASVLIVDDDVAVRGLLRMITERYGITADDAASGIECLDLLGRNAYDVVVLDVSLPSANSSELLEYLRRAPDAPAVVVLTKMNRWSFVETDLASVQCVLRKPFDPEIAAAMIASVASTVGERRRRNSMLIRRDEPRPSA